MTHDGNPASVKKEQKRMAVRGCQFGGLEDGGVTDRECQDRVLKIYLCK